MHSAKSTSAPLVALAAGTSYALSPKQIEKLLSGENCAAGSLDKKGWRRHLLQKMAPSSPYSV
jgi:hypothetical protein